MHVINHQPDTPTHTTLSTNSPHISHTSLVPNHPPSPSSRLLYLGLAERGTWGRRRRRRRSSWRKEEEEEGERASIDG